MGLFGSTIVKNYINSWNLKRLSFGKDNFDWRNVDDLNIIINKLSDTFVSGTLTVLDDKGEATTKPVPNRITFGNPSEKDYRKLHKKIYEEKKKWGVAYLYFKSGTSYYLLENESCYISYKTINSLELTEWIDLYQSFKYTENGKTVDILSSIKDGNATLIPIFDLGFNFSCTSVKTRGEQICDILKLDEKALKAGQSMFNRTSMMLLAPKGSNSDYIPAFDMNDEKIAEQREKFQESISIEKGAVNVLNKPYEVLDTNPDNRKLDVVNHVNFAKEGICNQFGYPYKLYRGETKFDDLKIHVPQLYLNMQPDSDAIMNAICTGLGIKERVRYDYSDIIEKTIPNYEDQGQQATSTDGTEQG